MIKPPRWFGAKDETIPALYGMIVAQARSAVFYRNLGVADTVDGRFDMLVLHVVLVMRRLARDAGATRAMGQGIFDCFCRDLDDNLREMGVGDLKVPREMRRMAEAFYGRQAAYEAALAELDDGALVKALARNIYADAAGDMDNAVVLAGYVRDVVRCLDGLDGTALAGAHVAFPDPELNAVTRA
jgi:cytochrome b pre-mRNA-processing protein 3